MSTYFLKLICFKINGKQNVLRKTPTVDLFTIFFFWICRKPSPSTRLSNIYKLAEEQVSTPTLVITHTQIHAHSLSHTHTYLHTLILSHIHIHNLSISHTQTHKGYRSAVKESWWWEKGGIKGWGNLLGLSSSSSNSCQMMEAQKQTSVCA